MTESTTMTPSADAAAAQLYTDQTASASSTLRQLNDSYAALRGEARLINTDIETGHRTARRYDLDERTSQKAKRAPRELLDELATDRGLSWATIARLCRVSVSAVRKWRAGDPPSGEKRLALARLAAFLDLVGEMPVADPGSWLSMPLVAQFGATGEDLFVADRLDELLDYAAGHVTAKDMLDTFDENWRTRFSSDWEIVDAPDGERSIRRRAQDR